MMQFAQRKPQHVALGADRQERGRARRAVGGRDRAQRLAERERIVGLDRGDAAGAEAEAGEDRFGERDGLVQAGDVVARLCAQQKAQRRRAVGEGGRDRFEPDLRHLVDRERQHVRRQAVAVARQRVDQRRRHAARRAAARPARAPPASR